MSSPIKPVTISGQAPWLTSQEAWQKLSSYKSDHQKNYFGFYSSRLGGFCQDASAMLIPLDDHMVHRGDGIFEVFRVDDGVLIDVDAHLARLHESAKAVGLVLRWSDKQIRDLCLELVRLCGESALAQSGGKTDGLIRLFVSRGEGSFTPNPLDCVEAELYIVLTKFKAPAPDLVSRGALVVSSKWPWKASPFAQIKSCNYLLNVLLKQEANEAKVHFAAAFDQDGFLTESSTENIIVVMKDKKIFVPKWDHILRGTTLLWVMELAKNKGFTVEQQNISREMIRNCSEAAIVGTTWGVLPVGQWDGVAVGVPNKSATDVSSDNAGFSPVCMQLRELLNEAIKNDSSRRCVQ